MELLDTPLAGVFLVERRPFRDHRGTFSRVFSRRFFAEHGLNTEIWQTAESTNPRRGTLRGLHYQLPPCAEVKLVRVTHGAVFDVVLDLRPGSVSYGRWWSTTLRAGDQRLLYIPEGCAHGYQTLEPDTVVAYQMSAPYAPELARGVRWDSPALAIPWPVPDPILSERDRALPAALSPAGDAGSVDQVGR